MLINVVFFRGFLVPAWLIEVIINGYSIVNSYILFQIATFLIYILINLKKAFYFFIYIYMTICMYIFTYVCVCIALKHVS